MTCESCMRRVNVLRFTVQRRRGKPRERSLCSWCANELRKDGTKVERIRSTPVPRDAGLYVHQGPESTIILHPIQRRR